MLCYAMLNLAARRFALLKGSAQLEQSAGEEEPAGTCQTHPLYSIIKAHTISTRAQTHTRTHTHTHTNTHARAHVNVTCYFETMKNIRDLFYFCFAVDVTVTPDPE